MPDKIDPNLTRYAVKAPVGQAAGWQKIPEFTAVGDQTVMAPPMHPAQSSGTVNMKIGRNPETGKHPVTGKRPDRAPEAGSSGFFATPPPVPQGNIRKLWGKFSRNLF
jgi:hypothetical protein